MLAVKNLMPYKIDIYDDTHVVKDIILNRCIFEPVKEYTRLASFNENTKLETVPERVWVNGKFEKFISGLILLYPSGWKVKNMPEPEKDIMFLVSKDIAMAADYKDNLIYPDKEIYSPDGKIVVGYLQLIKA